MTKKIPLTLTLAALVGFAAPAFAAETHAAKHDPQAATTTAKPKAQEHKAAPAKESKAAPVKGRKAKASKKANAKAAPAKTTAEKPAPAAQPATK